MDTEAGSQGSDATGGGTGVAGDWPALERGISPMTPWKRPGGRWHVHLPVTDQVRAYARALAPALGRFADRLQPVPERFLHCTLAWVRRPVSEAVPFVDIDRSEDGIAALAEHTALGLRLHNWRDDTQAPVDAVPVAGLGWAPGGPVLALDTAAARPLADAAYRGVMSVAMDAWTQGAEQGWRPHVALAYATADWTPGEVAELDQALRAAARDIPLPDPLPARRLLVCVQDTFAPGGLAWTHERLVEDPTRQA
uniref:hypothetical protein n=1 Tax=Amycolatopsis sp. CA-096443 TaxID=3239919 RepID=UPI003F497056